MDKRSPGNATRFAARLLLLQNIQQFIGVKAFPAKPACGRPADGHKAAFKRLLEVAIALYEGLQRGTERLNA